MKEKDITFSFGAELEFADVWRFDRLPDGCMWNTKDCLLYTSPSPRDRG